MLPKLKSIFRSKKPDTTIKPTKDERVTKAARDTKSVHVTHVTHVAPVTEVTQAPKVGDFPEDTGEDENFWDFPLGKISSGDFSFAVVQANTILEDQAQVESSPSLTFIGIHDGHGGAAAAKFVNEKLYPQFQRVLEEAHGVLSENVICRAFADVEAEFMEVVRGSWKHEPQMAAVGSCSLVGIISGEKLYVASLGDSRAVLGTHRKGSGMMTAIQLSTDHNANYKAIRQELSMKFPKEKDVVVERGGVWRVKGIIQVSRAIGDVYLKSNEFQTEPLFPRFRLKDPINVPVLIAEPEVIGRALHSSDKFVIFASDGLWEHVTNQEAVDMVHGSPHVGVAQRLVVSALIRAAKKRDIAYEDLPFLEEGQRRLVHDDISVIVFFFDHGALSHGHSSNNRHISIKSCQSEVNTVNKV